MITEALHIILLKKVTIKYNFVIGCTIHINAFKAFLKYTTCSLSWHIYNTGIEVIKTSVTDNTIIATPTFDSKFILWFIFFPFIFCQIGSFCQYDLSFHCHFDFCQVGSFYSLNNRDMYKYSYIFGSFIRIIRQWIKFVSPIISWKTYLNYHSQVWL